MFPSENFYKLTALIKEKENNQISYKQFVVCAHSLKEAIFELISGLPKDFYNKYEFESQEGEIYTFKVKDITNEEWDAFLMEYYHG